MDLNRVHSLKNYQFIVIKDVLCQTIYGSYGNVQLAKCTKTGHTVAIKKLNYKISQGEFEMLRKITHPNIVNLFDWFFDQKNQATFLVLEYKESRTLFDYIKFTNSREKETVNKIFEGVLSAMDYLHSKNLFRLDIKPENILIDSNYTVRLCYFGISLSRMPRMSICRSLEYLAPEALLKLPYTSKVDIWALGILLYELIDGKTPFQGRTQQQILNSIKKPSVFSNNFSFQQIRLITFLLKINPKQRLQSSQIIKPSKPQTTVFKKTEQVSKISTIDELPASESKIKLLQIKTIEKPSLDPNPTNPNINMNINPNFNITSIKKIKECDKSPSNYNELMMRIEKNHYSHSMYNKEKISLRKYFKKERN